MEELSQEEFESSKRRILTSVDLSKKGSIDSDIVNLVQLINADPDFVTTSSCSGRIVLFSKEEGDSKSGCNWLLVSHNEVNASELAAKTKLDLEQVVFKFEPFIMHISCRNLVRAKALQDCALSAGFRNSGLVVGKKGRITFAVRSTHGLEVPVRIDGRLLLSEEYIGCLAKLANDKLATNRLKINKFQLLCQEQLVTSV